LKRKRQYKIEKKGNPVWFEDIIKDERNASQKGCP
jgi:hypothetical protein